MDPAIVKAVIDALFVVLKTRFKDGLAFWALTMIQGLIDGAYIAKIAAVAKVPTTQSIPE